jgi:hypothetical protein
MLGPMEDQTADDVGSLAIIKTDDRCSNLPATLVEPIEGPDGRLAALTLP